MVWRAGRPQAKWLRSIIGLAGKLSLSVARDELCAAAAEFDKLRRRRNDLLRGQPASTDDGAQQLIRGHFLQVETIDEAAVAFRECNNRLVALWSLL